MIPRNLYEQVEACINSGDVAGAEVLIIPLVEQYPNNHDVWHNLAVVEMARGDLDCSIASFQRCLSFNPHFEEALYNYAMALYQHGNYEESLRQLRTVIALNPNRWKAIESANQLCCQIGRWWDSYLYAKRYVGLFPHKRASILPNMVIALQNAEQERQDDFAVKAELMEILTELNNQQGETLCQAAITEASRSLSGFRDMTLKS